MVASRSALCVCVVAPALTVAGCGSVPSQRAVSVKAAGAISSVTPTTNRTTVATTNSTAASDAASCSSAFSQLADYQPTEVVRALSPDRSRVFW